jgi:hypothetical protein
LCGGFVVKRGGFDGAFPGAKNVPLFLNLFFHRGMLALQKQIPYGNDNKKSKGNGKCRGEWRRI